MDRTNFDEALDALGDTYRRRLLVELLEAGSAARVPVPTRAGGGPGGAGSRIRWDGGGTTSPSIRPERAVAVTHTHLPKLEQYGFVEWERDEEVVTRGNRFDEIRPMLELLHENAATLPDGWR